MKRILVLLLFFFCLSAISAQESFEQSIEQLNHFYPAQEHSEQADWIEKIIGERIWNY